MSDLNPTIEVRKEDDGQYGVYGQIPEFFGGGHLRLDTGIPTLAEAMDFAYEANESNPHAEFRVVNQTGEEVAA